MNTFLLLARQRKGTEREIHIVQQRIYEVPTLCHLPVSFYYMSERI